eukprot:2374300-Rhodomonas_salina.2
MPTQTKIRPSAATQRKPTQRQTLCDQTTPWSTSPGTARHAYPTWSTKALYTCFGLLDAVFCGRLPARLHSFNSTLLQGSCALPAS